MNTNTESEKLQKTKHKLASPGDKEVNVTISKKDEPSTGRQLRLHLILQKCSAQKMQNSFNFCCWDVTYSSKLCQNPGIAPPVALSALWAPRRWILAGQAASLHHFWTADVHYSVCNGIWEHCTSTTTGSGKHIRFQTNLVTETWANIYHYFSCEPLRIKAWCLNQKKVTGTLKAEQQSSLQPHGISGKFTDMELISHGRNIEAETSIYLSKTCYKNWLSQEDELCLSNIGTHRKILTGPREQTVHQ